MTTVKQPVRVVEVPKPQRIFVPAAPAEAPVREPVLVPLKKKEAAE